MREIKYAWNSKVLLKALFFFFWSGMIGVTVPGLFVVSMVSIFLLKSKFVFVVNSITRNKFMWNLFPRTVLQNSQSFTLSHRRKFKTFLTQFFKRGNQWFCRALVVSAEWNLSVHQWNKRKCKFSYKHHFQIQSFNRNSIFYLSKIFKEVYTCILYVYIIRKLTNIPYTWLPYRCTSSITLPRVSVYLWPTLMCLWGKKQELKWE